jgi:hypothetical protein
MDKKFSKVITSLMMVISIGYCISHSQITIEINGNVVIEHINNNENIMYV